MFKKNELYRTINKCVIADCSQLNSVKWWRNLIYTQGGEGPLNVRGATEGGQQKCDFFACRIIYEWALKSNKMLVVACNVM